jgi:DNA end-binding protein Ku
MARSIWSGSVSFETSRGKFVVFEPGELDELRPAATKTIDIEDFVALDDIDVFPERKASVSAREKQMAAQIVDSLARDWDPSRYHDDYEEQLRAVIKAKSKGNTIEPEAPKKSAEVIELMDALHASLEKPRGTARRGGARAGSRAAAQKATKRSATRRSASGRRTKRSA